MKRRPKHFISDKEALVDLCENLNSTLFLESLCSLKIQADSYHAIVENCSADNVATIFCQKGGMNRFSILKLSATKRFKADDLFIRKPPEKNPFYPTPFRRFLLSSEEKTSKERPHLNLTHTPAGK